MADRRSDDLTFALERGFLGVCAFGEDFLVTERQGALSAWAPPPGESAVDRGLLLGLASELAALRAPGAEPLLLPSVAAPELLAPRVNVAIAWNAETAAYVATTTLDASSAQFERLLASKRREELMLREQTEAASDRLAVSASRYRDIVNSTEDAVLRLKPDLRVSYLNPTAAALFGLPADAGQGVAIRDLAPLPNAENPWRRDMCAGGPASFEQPIRRGADVTWLWWRVHWLERRSGPGEFQAVGRDISETKRLRAELDRANELANFAALADERLRISHELHDTFVHTLVETLARLSLLRRAAPEGPLKGELEEAERETRAGLRAAREAVGAVRSDLDFPDGPGPRIVEAVRALQGKINVTLELAPDLGELSPIRAAAIARVAREALRNIERHSGAREARVALARRGDDVVLEIADDGIGFSPDAGPSGHYGLVGMREQAKFAGGRLQIDAAPGKGARLTLAISAL
jgi:PAS domain S-box-containing protein